MESHVEIVGLETDQGVEEDEKPQKKMEEKAEPEEATLKIEEKAEPPESEQVTKDRQVSDMTVLPSSKCEFKPNELYKCRFCGLTYMYLNTLKAHERVHDVEEPYVCTKCGDSFRFYSEMEYHMLGHQGQKVYKCQCGRGFYRYTDLLYHKHPGEDEAEEDESSAFKPQHPLKVYPEVSKPYICQYCSKSYANSRDLKFHIYSHRGERAFVVSSSRYLITRSDP